MKYWGFKYAVFQASKEIFVKDFLDNVLYTSVKLIVTHVYSKSDAFIVQH